MDYFTHYAVNTISYKWAIYQEFVGARRGLRGLNIMPFSVNCYSTLVLTTAVKPMCKRLKDCIESHFQRQNNRKKSPGGKRL
jgi:hypothetical protein